MTAVGLFMPKAKPKRELGQQHAGRLREDQLDGVVIDDIDFFDGQVFAELSVVVLEGAAKRYSLSGLRQRSMFQATASALKGVPSWKFTPSRRWKVQVWLSSVSQDSASQGIGLVDVPSRRTSGSMISLMTRADSPSVAGPESSRTESPPRPTISVPPPSAISPPRRLPAASVLIGRRSGRSRWPDRLSAAEQPSAVEQ